MRFSLLDSPSLLLTAIAGSAVRHPGDLRPDASSDGRDDPPDAALTVAFNVMLTREVRPSRFWPWFALGNLHLVPALWVMRMIPGL